MKYIIPALPPSDNKYKGRTNIWQYWEDKKDWEKLVFCHCRPRPDKPIPHATVTLKYFFKTRVRHDPDNYSGKFILDGLVRCGILIDDSFDHVNLVLRGGYDKNNPRTEIEVEENDAKEQICKYYSGATIIQQDTGIVQMENGRRIELWNL